MATLIRTSLSSHRHLISTTNLRRPPTNAVPSPSELAPLTHPHTLPMAFPSQLLRNTEPAPSRTTTPPKQHPTHPPPNRNFVSIQMRRQPTTAQDHGRRLPLNPPKRRDSISGKPAMLPISYAVGQCLTAALYRIWR